MLELISNFFGTITDLASLFYFTAGLIIFIFFVKLLFKLFALIFGFKNNF